MAEIASLNSNPGAAGFFPEVDVIAGHSAGQENLVLTENGIEFPSERITNSVTNLDAALNWTIFDGFKMFSTYNKLKEFESLGLINARIQIENTVSDIISSYFNIIRIQKRIAVLENTVEISQERHRIADTKLQIGSGSEYDFLLAQTDLNSDRTALIRESVLLNDAKVRLMTLLNLDPITEFIVSAEIELDDSIEFNQVLNAISSENKLLNAAQIQTRIASLERQEVLRGRMPTIDLNTGYQVNHRETENSIRRLQEVDGIRYGVTVRIPIFDGFNINRKLQAARIYEKNAELSLNEITSQLNSLAVAEFHNYVSSRNVVELERQNLDLANQTIQIALERFYQGTISSLELRESQRTLIDTETRLITAQYEAKLSETELFKLMGRLAVD
jgi:outer membrane protein TolC